MIKNICFALCLLFTISLSSQSQDSLDQLFMPKVSSVDSILFNLYDVISGDKGVERNWDLFKYLFKEDAKLIPIRKTQEGSFTPNYLSAEDYIKLSGAWLENNGFHEKEIYRKSERFGNIMHVFSTYEGFKSKTDAEPFVRGINSIQLLFDNKRWWVVNIYWQAEDDSAKLPQEYLPK